MNEWKLFLINFRKVISLYASMYIQSWKTLNFDLCKSSFHRSIKQIDFNQSRNFTFCFFQTFKKLNEEGFLFRLL